MNTLEIRPLAYALGAEVGGVDLTQPLDGETRAAIKRAWNEHLVLCFRSQRLTPREFRDFSLQFDFGELDRNEWKPQSRDPEIPEVLFVRNKPVPAGAGGGVKRNDGVRGTFWHSDLSFSERPASATLLLAQQMPEVGGNTMFTNMYAAYEALTPAMQKLLGSLYAAHRKSDAYDPDEVSAQEQAQLAALGTVVHPLVPTHPETGRKALFYGGQRSRRFIGMTEEESKPILDFIGAHITRPEFVYRHVWRLNDLIIWDNRCTMHCVVPDFDPSQSRSLMRCSFVGPKTGLSYDASMESNGVETAVA